MSFNANLGETVKNKDTIALDNDVSDNIQEIGSEFINKDTIREEQRDDKTFYFPETLSDTKVSKDQFRNETSFQFNITNAASSNFGSSRNTVVQAGSELTADFNGDGFEDKAIGVPSEDIDNVQNVGVVHVIYGSSFGLSASGNSVVADQLWHQGHPDLAILGTAPEPDDDFGSSLSSGDYNGDGHDDLAIGVPFEDIGSKIDAGVIYVIYGSPVGLSATGESKFNIFFQGSPSTRADVAEAGDRFGWSLSSGDYNNDTKDDLAVGVLIEDVSTLHAGIVEGAGAVHVIYGSTGGLSPSAVLVDQLWTQLSIDIEPNEFFSSSLSSADFNGDDHDDLAIGVPQENIGSLESAGAVHVIYGSAGGLSSTAVLPVQIWTQNSGLEDDSEQFDDFGVSLSSGDYNADGHYDLAIGVRGENIVDGSSPVGKVHVIYGSQSGLSATSPIADQLWMQGGGGLDGLAEAVDLFGWSLSSGDYNGDGPDDLSIGVPGEDVEGETIGNAGTVHVIYGSSSGLSTTSPIADQLWI